MNKFYVILGIFIALVIVVLVPYLKFRDVKDNAPLKEGFAMPSFYKFSRKFGKIYNSFTNKRRRSKTNWLWY